ncbi:MAG: beta-galactosidase, partial [Bacteroidetes bacterium]|nr:beta-galactosidase [Bacteroidota bacterium]
MRISRLVFLFSLLSFLSIDTALQAQAKHSFAIGDSAFLLDGKPFQIISGEMHYPRVPRESWRARMRKAKLMGLNTISTYVFWNIHEPQKNKFDFTGNYDVAAFVRTAQEEGLWVILRPSPYVCAEWEFGGYPYWLQREKGLVVRSKEPQYLKEYKQYIDAVGKQLAPLQINHGGNVLMVQVENEYGSYGSDKEYLEINRKMFVDAGFDGVLYTCDPAADVSKGHLPGLYAAVNGEDKPDKVRKVLHEANGGKGPLFIAEWYPAWFDWWGTKHHTVPADDYTARLDAVLKAGISINMYMFHGGTTRGFMNGANVNDHTPYEPQISSYDYDAPLDEAGAVTEKFMRFKEVISKYQPGEPQPDGLPPPPPPLALVIPDFALEYATGLFDVLPPAKSSEKPMTFEDLGQAYGYVLYRTKIPGGRKGELSIKEVRDYALVFVNGQRQGILDRRLKEDHLMLDLPAGEVQLDILVENMGRVNFGPYLLKNTKGITEKVMFAGQELKGWQQFGFPFESEGKYVFKGSPLDALMGQQPVIRRGTFKLDEIGDTY